MLIEPLERRSFFSATGLDATYFDNLNFGGKSTAKVDHAVDFDFGTDKPASGIHSESYSIRWTTRLKALSTESYRLMLQTESPVRLWVDNVLVIDAWKTPKKSTTYKGSYNFTSGQRYAIQIEMAHNTGNASIHFQWQTDTMNKTTVPGRLMSPTDPGVQAKLNHALIFARDQIAATVNNAPSPTTAGYPEIGTSKGWTYTASSEWTSGYLGGEMWELDKALPNTGWNTKATTWTMPLSVESHDSGDSYSRLWDTFKPMYDKTHNVPFADILVDAADAKDAEFSTKIGAFQTPGQISNSGNKKATFGVLIDQTMDLDLMYWASSFTGDPRYANHANQHLQTVISKMIRSDGSVFQRYFFDGSTNAPLGGENYQGLSNTSTWSRGQAWAIAGIAKAAQDTGNQTFIDAAKKVADYFVAHLPSDFVPYWDFNATVTSKTPRDSSAAAIAADGLITLSKVTGDNSYRDDAANILNSLASASYLTEGTTSPGILMHGALNVPKNISTDVSLVFGDYHFLKAMNDFTS